MQHIQIGDKSFINPDKICRWTYFLTAISPELTGKDIYEILVTVWLDDGTSARLHGKMLRDFHQWLFGDSLYDSSGEPGSFSYYMAHAVAYERIQKEPA